MPNCGEAPTGREPSLARPSRVNGAPEEARELPHGGEVMMRSVGYKETGGTNVLEVFDRNIPDVTAGHIRVRVVVSGVNPTDWKARQGLRDGETLGRLQVPNQDGAGFVDAVGEGVTGFKVGDRVWVWEAAWQRTEGTGQEYTVLPERQVVKLPDVATFDAGASLGIPALTAHRALTAFEGATRELAPRSLAGRTVLVAGGAGAVGHAAIQLALWAGAHVIATVSGPQKAELATRSGAHRVVNYREENVAAAVLNQAPKGADIIVEVSPSANLAIDLEAAAVNGTIAIYASATFGSSEPEVLEIPVRTGMTKNLRFQFILTYNTNPQEKEAAVRAVSAALADGALQVGLEHGLPIHRYALDEMALAHRASESGVLGKVLVDVAPVAVTSP